MEAAEAAKRENSQPCLCARHALHVASMRMNRGQRVRGVALRVFEIACWCVFMCIHMNEHNTVDSTDPFAIGKKRCRDGGWGPDP